MVAHFSSDNLTLYLNALYLLKLSLQLSKAYKKRDSNIIKFPGFVLYYKLDLIVLAKLLQNLFRTFECSCLLKCIRNVRVEFKFELFKFCFMPYIILFLLHSCS